MSSITWTPGALKSDARPVSETCWRVIEAQHLVSTMKLTDTLEDQQILENLIEETKPPIPEECRHLDFLLFTPFRYSAANPRGSRFRRPFAARGVFYAAQHPETAIAETVFYRTLFYAESPGTPWPANPGEFTAFAVGFSSPVSIDIATGPLSSDVGLYHLSDYGISQQFSEDVRAAGLEVITYRSVRDAARRNNFALLTCSVFTDVAPTNRRSWKIHLDANGARAICETPRVTLAFDRNAFVADPRLAGLVWTR